MQNREFLVALRSDLKSLDLDETTGYVRRRRHLAGADKNAQDVFPGDTIAKIRRFARGIPRVINTISENALITAYARQLAQVPSGLIEEVADDLCLGVANSPRIQTSRRSDDVLEAVRTFA